ncbi:hypothetical protein BW721_03870 [Jeotgalibaca sp. PTS2502]|jgi:hypothetical protein|uniref:YjzD family protein n=2 Tax=Jeotgalibaca TaxID=1470540 RepID=A0A6G7KC26_9LACT|nr:MULTISPECIES: YjzD family protein [Jeotgalibaca]APZ48884.1 hypothetical protein BW721_03870 [Jeotgalibaca sp. PTS2502]QII82797.1 YjzD family protein [Jeotgalibaca arthritidis]HJA89385.1 YjzD family protein [Candidatus Jeotgalibaca merdavium]
MKFVVCLFWGFILGQVAFYIGGALETNSYNFVHASVMGIAVAVIVFLLTSAFPKTAESKKA